MPLTPTLIAEGLQLAEAATQGEFVVDRHVHPDNRFILKSDARKPAPCHWVPVLWAWYIERREDAEMLAFAGTHLRTALLDLQAAQRERDAFAELWPKVLEAAQMVWIQPEYDCPGGPPELCGYQCGECKGFGDTEETIEHAAGCIVPRALALESALRAALGEAGE